MSYCSPALSQSSGRCGRKSGGPSERQLLGSVPFTLGRKCASGGDPGSLQPLTETTTCNVYIDAPQQTLCNYTDLQTGEPWFCYKPKKLSCDNRVSHAMGGFKKNIKPQEEKLFQSGINLKVSIPPSSHYNISVLPRIEDQTKGTSDMRKNPSGYYYHGVWRPLDGTKLQQFNSSKAASQCLRGKVLHLFGDSTIRQWFEYFISSFPDLKTFDLHTSKQTGLS
ncbi:hypothetical protein OJAV_G00219320 [Oryzias javanicus]|uniref:NXPE C-terminal domain-containing protein n=1 Tax=Oryzias javanicus TaxID=123683 RepID=A0A437C1P8_ORYJA|nr:hypothetical protein OJAV_G00219320 [Oryzias javanicus]